MINFTVGPVQMEEEIRKIGAEQIPYFRTPEFSELMKENERLMKKFMGASRDARALFLTASGSGAMEASVINLFSQEDKLLVVEGGSFGHRFVEICQIHRIPHQVIKLPYGKALKPEHLEDYRGKGFTGFLVNLHETSTGVLYDMELISSFCKSEKLWLVVDSISSFLADPFFMEDYGVDAVMTGSQKALALPPGISIVVLSERAVDRIMNTPVRSLYFGYQSYLKDGARGQTPFTPAVSVLLQMNVRLKDIEKRGLLAEQEKIRALAEDFRNRLEGLKITIPSEHLSNGLTPIHPTEVSAYGVFQTLKEKYDLVVCPNGGELADQIFRVGHMGDLSIEDNKRLIDALWELQDGGML